MYGIKTHVGAFDPPTHCSTRSVRLPLETQIDALVLRARDVHTSVSAAI